MSPSVIPFGAQPLKRTSQGGHAVRHGGIDTQAPMFPAKPNASEGGLFVWHMTSAQMGAVLA